MNNKIYTDEQIEAVIKAANDFGIAMNNIAQDISKFAAALVESFARILPMTNDPHGWNKTWERTIKKLARRERYLRRYKQRGLRMKKR